MTGPRMLIINGYFPTPDVDSGSISITNFMRMALSLNFQVSHLVPREFTERAPDNHLEALGVRTVGAPRHRSPEAFLESHGSRFAVVVLSGFGTASAFYRIVRERCPQARIIFNAVDLNHVRFERQANVMRNPDLLRRAADARRKELFLIENSDATIVVSDAELGRLKQIMPGAPVFHIPLIRDIPGRVNGFAPRADIALVGHFLHAPNPDAALVFAAAIWPRVHKALPDARFRMIGAGWPAAMPPPPGDGIDLVGHVADMGATLERLRLTVAPLRFGAGAKGKIVTSLAHGVPCVATPIAAEGMGFTDGVNLLIASDFDQFAGHVVALYSDEALWERLSAAGLAFVKQNHSFEHGVQLLGRMMMAIGLAPGGDATFMQVARGT